MLVIMMNWGEGMNPEGFVDGMDGFGHLCAGIGVENPLIQYYRSQIMEWLPCIQITKYVFHILCEVVLAQIYTFKEWSCCVLCAN